MHLRPGLAEGGVREGLERVVHRLQLVRDPERAVGRVELAVDPVQLLGDPVEPGEDRVELAVFEGAPFVHAAMVAGAPACDDPPVRRVLLVVPLVLALAACGGGGPAFGDGVATIGTARGPVDIRVEVADTPAARERGLAGRDALPPATGMAFVHARDVDDVGLWMRDTDLPLTAAFVDGAGTITAIVDMAPCPADPCPVYRPPGPYRIALEVGLGELERLGVRVGDRVSVRAG